MIMPNLLWRPNHLGGPRYSWAEPWTYCTSLTAGARRTRHWHESCLSIEEDYES